MERFALRKIVSSVCDDYIDTLLTGIEENEDDFPYAIACSNFIDELKKKNIIVDFETFFNEIKKYNCGIEFLCEKIDTNGAAGMMFTRILGIFAQFERELIKERTLVGVESAVNKGHFGGKPPLGYKTKLDDDGKKLKKWIIN